MRWYVALKKKFIAENQNLDWDALKNEMLKNMILPFASNLLRTEIRSLQYKGNLAKYCRSSALYESQNSGGRK